MNDQFTATNSRALSSRRAWPHFCAAPWLNKQTPKARRHLSEQVRLTVWSSVLLFFLEAEFVRPILLNSIANTDTMHTCMQTALNLCLEKQARY